MGAGEWAGREWVREWDMGVHASELGCSARKCGEDTEMGKLGPVFCEWRLVGAGRRIFQRQGKSGGTRVYVVEELADGGCKSRPSIREVRGRRRCDARRECVLHVSRVPGMGWGYAVGSSWVRGRMALFSESRRRRGRPVM